MRLTYGFALTVLLVASPALVAEANMPKSESLEVESSEVESSKAEAVETDAAATDASETETSETETSETETSETETSETETAEVKTQATPLEAIRIAVQTRLSEKFSATSVQKEDEKGAIVEFYAAPDGKLLWVDEDGLTTRGKAVIAEIEKADDYGLVASDYALPDMTGFDSRANDATDTLAEAEIKISRAVLDYAHDVRGGRLNPSRISKNLDPTLLLPKPIEVLWSISFRSDPAAYLRGFQPQHPQFERLRRKLIDLRNGGETAKDEAPKIKMRTAGC